MGLYHIFWDWITKNASYPSVERKSTFDELVGQTAENHDSGLTHDLLHLQSVEGSEYLSHYCKT